MKPIPTVLVTACLLLGTIIPAQSAPCRAYTVDEPNNPNNPFGYTEVNNCPILKGTFRNSDREVEISLYEPGAYYYRAKNFINGSSIELLGFDVIGTTLTG
jgi:hypothetical protein